LWQALGLQGIELQINSLGQLAERAVHRQALIDYLSAHSDQLDADAQRRLHANPLRILDTKNPQMQALVDGAPRLMDYLGAESLAHFEGFKRILDANGIRYTINPRLVRGMDYYNLSVFEFVTTELGAQGTVCAGGRYDGLFEQVGGKATPAVGWALGMERLLELLKTQERLPAPAAPDCYAIVPNLEHSGAVALACRTLRHAGARIQLHATAGEGQGSMKSQFKKANGSGARWALVFGDEELTQNTVTVKDLRSTEAGGANQVTIALSDLTSWWQSQS
jgi:histidyl-tRNA synthetase